MKINKNKVTTCRQSSLLAFKPVFKKWCGTLDMVIKLLYIVIDSNRPFPSSHVPLFQSESKYETILMKMTDLHDERFRT